MSPLLNLVLNCVLLLTSITIIYFLGKTMKIVCQFLDNAFTINALLIIHFGRIIFLDRFNLGVDVYLGEVSTQVLHFVSKWSSLILNSLGNAYGINLLECAE